MEPCHRLLFSGPEAEAGKPADPSRAAGGTAGGTAGGCSLAAGAKAGSCGRAAGGTAGTGSRPVRGLAGSKRGRASLDDLEALLASIRAELRGSMHSMAAVLKERVSWRCGAAGSRDCRGWAVGCTPGLLALLASDAASKGTALRSCLCSCTYLPSAQPGQPMPNAPPGPPVPQAALLRRALLGQAIKRGLCPPCAAEAKRRRTQ